MSNMKWERSRRLNTCVALPQIIEAARYGDNTAYEEMVDRCYSPVLRYCKLMGSRSDAEDLTQETFLRALKSKSNFADINSLEAFMIHIAKYVCIDYVRQVSKTRRLHIELTSSKTNDDYIETFTEAFDFESMLSQLCPSKRNSFVLTQLLGFSYEDCSEIENVPVGTVRSRVSRARTILQNQMELKHPNYSSDLSG